MRSCFRELSHPVELPDCPTPSETAPSQIALPLAEEMQALFTLVDVAPHRRCAALRGLRICAFSGL
jgi:hypothetical protein